MSHRLPPLNGLRAFEASARHLSFKLAASELGVTAGAVSQQVKALEAVLGVELFRRLARGLLLTDAGEAYLPALSEAFRIISLATEEIAPALTGRKLRIGVSRELKKHLPAKWPKGIESLEPYVNCSMATEDLELVRSGQLDGVLRLSNGKGHGLSIEKIALIQDDATSKDIHYACVKGIAGCRQSRALVAALQSMFPSSDAEGGLASQ